MSASDKNVEPAHDVTPKASRGNESETYFAFDVNDTKAAGNAMHLEAKVKAAHEAMKTSYATALQKAKECGEALNELAPMLAKGKREAYYRKILGMTEKTATNYRNIAKNWKKIEKAGIETVTGALAILKKPRTSQQKAEKPKPPTMAEKMVTQASEATDALRTVQSHLGEIKAKTAREAITAQLAELKRLISEIEQAMNPEAHGIGYRIAQANVATETPAQPHA